MTTSLTMRIPSANSGTSARATPSCVDDATLIDRFLRTDDEEVFGILVRRYQDKVFRLAASILGRGADSEAEDAAQEVFIVVLRKLKTFRRVRDQIRAEIERFAGDVETVDSESRRTKSNENQNHPCY